MFEIAHHDDGKEKYDSHTVCMIDIDKNGEHIDLNLSNIYGYGDTYNEALNDFIEKFNKEIERLKSFEIMLNCTDTLVPIEVDCSGKPIKKEDK